MPIKQNSQQHNLSLDHQDWLSKKYPNVKKYIISLDNVFENFEKTLDKFKNELALANSTKKKVANIIKNNFLNIF